MPVKLVKDSDLWPVFSQMAVKFDHLISRFTMQSQDEAAENGGENFELYFLDFCVTKKAKSLKL